MKNKYFETSMLSLRKWYALMILLMVGVLSASAQTTWYVNDNSTAGDVYTSAVGAVGNTGSNAAPFATIADAILDRVMQRNHRFTLTGESLRQKPKPIKKEPDTESS